MALHTSTDGTTYTREYNSEVTFSQLQLDELKRLFPQVIYPPSTPMETLRHYFGQQSVIEAITRKTNGHKRT